MIASRSKKTVTVIPRSRWGHVGQAMVRTNFIRNRLRFSSHSSNPHVSLFEDGPASITAQGCDDTPLLAVAAGTATPLAFAHVVNQDVQKIHSEGDKHVQKVQSKGNKRFSMDGLSSDTSEEEFEAEDDVVKPGVEASEDSSSDEEFEF